LGGSTGHKLRCRLPLVASQRWTFHATIGNTKSDDNCALVGYYGGGNSLPTFQDNLEERIYFTAEA